jgi:hypothetical protein
LRPEDDELHDEDGNHIDPGRDRSLQGKMRRHMARHRVLESLPEEILAAGVELQAAEREVEQVLEHRRAVREYAARVADKHIKDGVPQVLVAKAFQVDSRTLRDYLKFGKAEHRNK